VATCEGQLDSEPVFVTWTLLQHVKGLLLWLPLVLAVGLIRSNRSPQVLWLVIPLVLGKAGLTVLAHATNMPAEVAGIFEYLAFGPLVMGLCVILLLGEKLGRCRKALTWGLAFLILVGTGVMGIMAYGYSEQLNQGLIFMAIVDSTILLAPVLTAWCCRKRYTGWRFAFWLALWTIVCCFISLIIYFLIMLATNEWGDQATNMFMQMISASLAFGGVIYLIQLPFLLLGMLNRFYRPRFLGVLGLTKAADQNLTQPVIPEIEEQ